jgi:hypothetical protein
MNYPVLMGIFDFVTLEMTDWLLILLLAPITFVYSEVLKIVLRRQYKHKVVQGSKP